MVICLSNGNYVTDTIFFDSVNGLASEAVTKEPLLEAVAVPTYV